MNDNYTRENTLYKKYIVAFVVIAVIAVSIFIFTGVSTRPLTEEQCLELFAEHGIDTSVWQEKNSNKFAFDGDKYADMLFSDGKLYRCLANVPEPFLGSGDRYNCSGKETTFSMELIDNYYYVESSTREESEFMYYSADEKPDELERQEVYISNCVKV